REDRGVLLGPVVIALHDVRAVDDDFAVDLFARHRRVDDDADAGDRLADASDLAIAGEVRGRDGARLGEAVALVDHDAEAVDELADLLRKGSGARERVLQATAEAGANLGEDELVGEAERHRLEQAEGLPIALLRGRAQAGIEERANG